MVKTESSTRHLSTAASSGRFVTLDVFRGLTVAAMILVTDPGTYSATYRQLRHADWNGVTATDIIFPAFLFIVGVAITLAFAARIQGGANRGNLTLHILRRSVILFVLGLALNGFPDYAFHTLRIPGILQRIAISYFCGGVVYLYASKLARGPAVLATTVTIGLLAAYWALLKWCPVPGIGPGHLDSQYNLPAYIDRLILGTNHMWAYGRTAGVGVTYDPEGILSTLPAIALTLIGVLAGIWMRTPHTGSQKAIGIFLAGLVLTGAGLFLSPFLPLNKRVMTPSFALFSSGVSLLLFALFYVLVDLLKSRRWTPPALVMGTNAILAFAVSTIITVLLDRIHITGAHVPLHTWGYEHLFATWLSPINASLAYAVAIVFLNIAIIIPLYRRRIFLKI